MNLFISCFCNIIMQIASGIDKDTVQHKTRLILIQRYNSLCRVSTSVPFENCLCSSTKHYLSQQCFLLSSSSSDFVLVFVFRQCHHLHFLINSAQQINNYIFLFTQHEINLLLLTYMCNNNNWIR